MAKTNDEVVEELLQNQLFLDTFALMTERFPEVDKSHIGELLVVGVLFERGMITRSSSTE
jgi:hypothetical protein